MGVGLHQQFPHGFGMSVRPGQGAEDAAAPVIDDAEDADAPVQLGKERQGIGIIHGGQIAHEGPGTGAAGGDPQKTGDLPVNSVGSPVGADVFRGDGCLGEAVPVPHGHGVAQVNAVSVRGKAGEGAHHGLFAFRAGDEQFLHQDFSAFVHGAQSVHVAHGIYIPQRMQNSLQISGDDGGGTGQPGEAGAGDGEDFRGRNVLQVAPEAGHGHVP